MSKTSSGALAHTTSCRSATASLRPSPSRPIRAPDERVVVAALGDSITEGSPGYDARKGGDERSQWEYWAAHADPRFEFRNHGRYGERTDEIAARLREAAGSTDILVVQGGINDIAQGVAPATAAACLQAMLRDAKTLVRFVAVADVLPWNNGWPDAEPRIRDLNERIAAIAAAERIPLLPFHRTLEDPARPGRMLGGCAHADGDHPSVEGYRLLGELVARTLASVSSR